MLNIVETSPQPIVHAKDGAVYANSRDVAEYFEKRHDNIVRDIKSLILSEPSLGLLRFEEGVYTLPETGDQQHRCFEMDRDGFTLLAMGFTGKKALKWKLKYIEAFNSMESELQQKHTNINVRDPSQLATIAIQLIEVNKELEHRAQKAETTVAEQLPKTKALERIAHSDGSLCVTDAAKTLQVRPKTLFMFLQSHGWIYRRTGTEHFVAYQDKIASGLLEHKTTTIYRSDGSEKTATQARITSKGLTRLALELQPISSIVA